jgi:hypothetical protein
MIFAHTIEQVLLARKVQTARIWKDNYSVSGWRDDGSPSLKIIEVSSVSKATLFDTRKLYYVGQVLSVQPKRGAKGVAKIRVLELAKRDVRYFTKEDIKREGFSDYRQFIQVWCSMHDKWLYKKAMRETFDFFDAVGVRPDELYTALVIRFELVTEQKAAA